MNIFAEQLAAVGLVGAEPADGTTEASPEGQITLPQNHRERDMSDWDRLHRLCARQGRKRPKYVQTACDPELGVYTCEITSGARVLSRGFGPTKQSANDLAVRLALQELVEHGSEKTGQPKVKKRTSRKDRRVEERKRKARRGSRRGRVFETVVRGYLNELAAAGLIDGFEYHQPGSEEDHTGKDFTVRQAGKEVSFGVTTSLRSRDEARNNHPDVHTFYFPHNTKPETVKRRVLELFTTSS